MNTFSPFGNDLFGDPIEPVGRGKIAQGFTMAPFSVLNTREGEWQDRKRAWKALGIKSEVGRDAIAYQIGDKATWDKEKAGVVSAHGREQDLLKNRMGFGTMDANDGSIREHQGTSIFDPVLTELAYKWFCKPGGQIVDPFAGGSVRGIVAHLLGLNYWGGELRREQVDSNRAQAAQIIPENKPEWVVGDSMETLDDAPPADFIFSCPPYGNLEVYSDDPKDISNMEYHTFLAAYKRIILRTCQKLKPNRFACFVVGDFRDGAGHYRNFVSDTIGAFLDQGLKLYNEAILVTAVGSLPIRITRQFEGGRKLGKTHQNVLVFVKGDWRKAAAACNA